MIVNAALKIEDRRYTARRHSDAIRQAIMAGEEAVMNHDNQGFVTDKGEYLTRKEAMAHAVDCGQLCAGTKTKLVSEDLW